MTTKETQEALEKRDKEINKLKSYNTRLAKALNKAGVEVPIPNWKEENKEEGESQD